LNGIVGRKAGSAPAYAYSPALKQAGFVWNEQKLVAFIRDSEKVVPGNKMRFLSFMSEKQAAEIVAYLRTQGAVAASPAPKR
jgi:cytochrome c